MQVLTANQSLHFSLRILGIFPDLLVDDSSCSIWQPFSRVKGECSLETPAATQLSFVSKQVVVVVAVSRSPGGSNPNASAAAFSVLCTSKRPCDFAGRDSPHTLIPDIKSAQSMLYHPCGRFWKISWEAESRSPALVSRVSSSRGYLHISLNCDGSMGVLDTSVCVHSHPQAACLRSHIEQEQPLLSNSRL